MIIIIRHPYKILINLNRHVASKAYLFNSSFFKNHFQYPVKGMPIFLKSCENPRKTTS